MRDYYYGKNLKHFNSKGKTQPLSGPNCTCQCDCPQFYKTLNELISNEYSFETQNQTKNSINKRAETIENVFKNANKVDKHSIEKRENPNKRVYHNVSEVLKCSCNQSTHPFTNRTDFASKRGVSPNVIQNSYKSVAKKNFKNYRNVFIDRSINKVKEYCIECTCNTTNATTNTNIKLLGALLTDSLQNTSSTSSSLLSVVSEDYSLDEVSLHKNVFLCYSIILKNIVNKLACLHFELKTHIHCVLNSLELI